MVIAKPKAYFKTLQYLSCKLKIEILVLPFDALALFQLLFLDKLLNTIFKNINKNTKIK